MSLVQTISTPGFYRPTTLADIVKISGAIGPNSQQRIFLQAKFSPHGYESFRALAPKVNTRLICLNRLIPQLKLCQFTYQSLQQKPCKTGIVISNRSTPFKGYLRYITVSLTVVEYSISDPSDKVPEQYLTAQRADVSYKLVTQTYLELEFCTQQQSISNTSAVLRRLLHVLTAEEHQHHWWLWQFKEKMNAFRRLILSLSLALSFSEPLLAARDLVKDLATDLAINPAFCLLESIFESYAALLLMDVVRRLRKLFTARGQQIMSSP